MYPYSQFRGNRGRFRSYGAIKRFSRFARPYRGATFAGRGVRKPYFTRAKMASRALRHTNWNSSPEELKYNDINSATYVCDTTGTVTLINGVAAGSTAITRIGRQCIWKQVIVSGKLAAVDDTIIGCRCDVAVIWDKQPGAAVPAMTDFFVEAKAGSPMNLNYRERFVIIAHKTYTIGGLTAAAPAVTPTVHAVSINVRLNLRTTFKGDANAIGDIATGAMYLVTLGSEADADGALFKVAVRLRFAER